MLLPLDPDASTVKRTMVRAYRACLCIGEPQGLTAWGQDAKARRGG
jgi:hypothetical protein